MATTTSKSDATQREQRGKEQEEVRVAAVGNERMQVEFRVDDLIRRLVEDRIRAVASCSGCRGCSASV